jgi:predicted transcriptional regulator
VRCGESSAYGGKPAVGDWGTRREVLPVVATGVAQRELGEMFMNDLGLPYYRLFDFDKKNKYKIEVMNGKFLYDMGTRLKNQ